jgi:hypothetical protein
MARPRVRLVRARGSASFVACPGWMVADSCGSASPRFPAKAAGGRPHHGSEPSAVVCCSLFIAIDNDHAGSVQGSPRTTGWNQQELARRAHVGIVTVHQLETGISQPRRATLDVIQRAFEAAGVEFIDENGGGPGVRMRKRTLNKG